MLIERFSFDELIVYQRRIKFVDLLYPLYLTIFTKILIELNRTPFDLIEGESELV